MYRLNSPSYQGSNKYMYERGPIYISDSLYSPYMYRETPMTSLDDEFEDEIYIGQPIEIMDDVKESFTTEEAREIAKELDITFDKFDLEQFRMGLDVELEHGRRNPFTDVTGDDPILTGKIALAHLNEFPDYYTRLKKMEEEAKAYWEGR